MNTQDLLARVRQITQTSDNDEDFTNAEILAVGTQALYERFSVPLLNVRSGYLLHRTTISAVTGQASYRLPPRAIVQGLEKLETSPDGRTWRALSILSDAETCDYSNSGRGDPRWVSLESDRVVLYPTPSSPNLQIKFSFYLRPSVLVEGTAAQTKNVVSTSLDYYGDGSMRPAIIGNWPTNLNAVSGFLDVWHSSGCGEVVLFDVPYVREVVGFGAFAAVFPAGTDISMVIAGDPANSLPDRFGFPDTTDALPLPVEMHSPFADYVSAIVLAMRGDQEKAALFSGKAEAGIKRVQDLIQPRIKSRPPVFRTRNTYLRRRIGVGASGWRP